MRRSVTTASCCRSWSDGARTARSRWCCSSSRWRCTCRSGSRKPNETYQRAFGFWSPPEPYPGEPTATVKVATSYRPRDHDPRSAISWPDIQLCMQLFDRLVEQWPERTIVPSLADRWEIADDGLRYVFHLRDGLMWSDGTPLTAGDIEFGIKRVLDPDHAGFVGGDLLRARERPGLLPGTQRGRGPGGGESVGRSHRSSSGW